MKLSYFSRNILLILYFFVETQGSERNRKEGKSSSSNISLSQRKPLEERAIDALVEELEPNVSGHIVWLNLLRKWNDPQESLTNQQLYSAHRALKQRFVSMNGSFNWKELRSVELHNNRPKGVVNLQTWKELCLNIWPKPNHQYIMPKCDPQIYKTNFQSKYNNVCIDATIYIQDVLACTCIYPKSTDAPTGVRMKKIEDKFFAIQSHNSEYFVFKRSNKEKMLVLVGLRNISPASNTSPSSPNCDLTL